MYSSVNKENGKQQKGRGKIASHRLLPQRHAQYSSTTEPGFPGREVPSGSAKLRFPTLQLPIMCTWAFIQGAEEYNKPAVPLQYHLLYTTTICTVPLYNRIWFTVALHFKL
ncbi:hypothetical protein J6590_101821 [Homalodisca vitripennis]|nr:hypothetical protein J6590_101821 [Homalodisca vitripennis]